MAWCPFAKKMELEPESTNQVAIKPTQFLLHSIAAPWNPTRMYEYWRDSTNLESHMGLGFDGSLAQYIGTQTRADANMHANRRPDGTGAVSIETASNLNHTDAWTSAQITMLIKVGVWMHQKHELPLRICRSHDDPGYGYHRLFPQWSNGGTACPGDARVNQFRNEVFPGIVSSAGGVTPPTSTQVISLSKLRAASFANPPAPGTPVTYWGVIVVEQALANDGFLDRSVVDGHYGGMTVTAYSKYQKSLGYTGDDANGHPGATSLGRLGAKHGFKVVP